MHKLSVGMNWQGARDRERLYDDVRAAHESGGHSVCTTEEWGRVAVSSLALLADRRENVQFGTPS